MLKPDEQIRLIIEYKKNKSSEIAQKIISSNYGLIIDSISKYEKIYSLDTSDMFQEGILGLYKALEKFNPYLGFNFSTYATNWISMFVLSYIKKNARIVTVTEYANNQLLKFRKSIDHLALIENWGNYKYEQIRILSDISNYDTVSNKEAKCPIDMMKIFHDKSMNKNINEILKTFSPKEKLTIRCRYCLNNGKKKTLEEIGYQFSITKERVRQIEKKALKKLKICLQRKGVKIGDMNVY